MRDILTFLAGLLILVLVAALAVPPFVDWREQRHVVEAAMARAAGIEVETEGAIGVRLLPSPRLLVERLRLGSAGPERASLDARSVVAEIALTPLLSGEVRFLESRVGRMEVKLPTGAGGDWRVPRSLLSVETLRRAWVFEDLAVGQLLLTTVDPRTGRTDQAYAEGVRLEAQSLAGPWRAEGKIDGTSFNLATGAITVGEPTALKLTTEGTGQPRLSVDARLQLSPAPDGHLVPALEGAARLTASAEISPVPFTGSATLKGSGRLLELESVMVEAGEGGATLRLGGAGQFRLDERRLVLNLDGRRLDLDGLLAASDAAGQRARTPMPLPPFPAEFTLRLDGVALGGEELTGLSARFTLVQERLKLDELAFTAPGQSQVAASGEAALATGGGASGRISVLSKAGDRFGAYLAKLGLGISPGDLPEGRPLEASADIVAAHPVTSLRNLRLQLGDAVVSGVLRYTAPEASGRGKIDAQLAIQGLDLTAVPAGTGIFEAARAVDLGLILDARNVGYGSGDRNGRIAARIASEGDGLSVERLEIADLAGANASLSGRIGPDGTGRIAGRLTARRAAPLVDLVGRSWFGPPAGLLPAFLREGAIDLAVTAERARSGGAATTSLATRLSGTVSGGSLDAEVTSGDGRLRGIAATLATDRASSWFGVAGASSPARPAKLQLSGARDATGRLALRIAGDVAGLRLGTVNPFTLAPGEGSLDGGEAELASDDMSAFLAAIGQPFPGPAAIGVKARLSAVAGVPRVQAWGRIAGTSLDADLFGPSPAQLGGTIALGRISLPWLASALALGPPAPAPSGGAAWSAARFEARRVPDVGGSVAIKAEAVDFGRGFVGSNAEFSLSTTPDGFAVRDFAASLLGGGVSGEFRLNRQGSLASLVGEGSVAEVALPQLIGPPFVAGRLSGTLRFGGSGESAAGLVGNLGGAGAIEVDGLEVAAADPAAVERVASRALRSDDPLSQTRLAALASEELARARLTPGKSSGQATLVGGALRVAPLRAEAPAAIWQGTANVDIRNLSLDLRGALTARAVPRGWTGAAPYLTLGWTGPVARPTRVLDVGPLANGLASVVLARELDRIETFELDAAERGRINARVEMDRARKAAAEEAARLERQREEAEKARAEAERILNAVGGPEPAGASRPPSGPSPALPPLDIRPPGQSRGAAGG